MSEQDDRQENPRKSQQNSSEGFQPYQPREGSYTRPAPYDPQSSDPFTPTSDIVGMPDPASALYTQSTNVNFSGESEHKKGILKTIIIIVLVVLVLGIIGGIGLMIFGSRAADDVNDSTAMEQDNLDSTFSQQASALAPIPDLASLFGMSLENAFNELDGEYGVVSKTAGSSAEFKPDCTTVVTLVKLEEPMKLESDSSNSENATKEESGEKESSDKDSSDKADSDNDEVATISVSTIVPDDPEQPHLKLLLDSHDMVVGTVMTMDLDSIKFPETSFSDLTATKSFIKEVLKTTDIQWPESYEYVAPSTKDYTTYKSGSSTDKATESYTFKGETDLGTSPEKFEIKLTYDYGSADSQNADSLTSVKRTLQISLA